MLLTGNLEPDPLLDQVLLCKRAVRDLMIFVVLFDEVLYDGPRLPEREARVRVLDGRHATVGVELEVRFLLHLRELDGFELEGDAQLLEDHADFDGVGADAVTPEGDGL